MATDTIIFKGKQIKMNKRELEWVWPGRIPRGYVTVLAAEGGVGKSGLALYLANQFTADNLKVIYVDAEKCDTHIKSRFDSWNLSHADDIYFMGKKRKDGDHATGIYDNLASIVRTLTEEKPDVVIFDSLTSLSADFDLNQMSNVTLFFKTLEELTELGNTAVIIIAHLRKPLQDNVVEFKNSDISGNAAIVNLARSVLMLRQAESNPDQRILIHTKSNLAPLAKELSFNLDPICGKIINFKEAKAKTKISTGTRMGKFRKVAIRSVESGLNKKEITEELKKSEAKPTEITRIFKWLKESQNIQID